MTPPERHEAMQQSWEKLLARYDVTPAAASPLFDLLVAAYSAPERHYHNLEHLDEMFRVACWLSTITDDTGPLQLAIWFHDAVYDPRAKDNEPRSADLAVDLLGPIGVPTSVLERVGQLIRATAHRPGDPPPGDRDTASMLDADLAILGAPEERYDRYAADIRKEYAWVSDAEYRKGRAAVLEAFLARPRIYCNDLLFQENEPRARANLRAELDRLRSRGPG
jgi:predicted metal-dependent HD superfamily phosphohydrolase